MQKNLAINKTHWEKLPGDLRICVSANHKFGTDAFLLSDFARAKNKELACDLGSGCGIIPALWFRKPQTTPKLAYAVELQEEGFFQMCRSVAEGGLPKDKFIPIHADLRDLSLPKGCFNLVTCNPPYKAQGQGILSRSEVERTARHEITCTLEDLCGTAASLLQYGGRLCICQRPERLVDAFCAMRLHGLEPKRLRFVQQKPEKAPWLFLLEARRGGKPFLSVEEPLLMQGEKGFSQEVLRIYQKSEMNGT